MFVIYRIFASQSGDLIQIQFSGMFPSSNFIAEQPPSLVPPSTQFTVKYCLPLHVGLHEKIVSVSYCEKLKAVVTSSVDNVVKVWDLRMQKILLAQYFTEVCVQNCFVFLKET